MLSKDQKIVLGICLAGLAVVVATVSIDVLNDQQTDEAGISGTYIYEASGRNSQTNETYSGTWTIVMDHGRVVSSTKDLKTTPSSSVTISPSGLTMINGYRAVKTLDRDVVEEMTQKNSMVSGCSYYGTDDFDTNYGTMTLQIFGSSNDYYALNTSGICYEIEETNGKASYVFKLTNIID